MNALWIDFVNSDWHDHLGRPGEDRDQLEDPDWVRQFLQKARLPPVNTRAPSVRQALTRQRALLKRFVAAAVARESLADADLAALNRYLRAPAVHPRLRRLNGNYRLDLTPVRAGLQSVQFAIAASLADFLVAGQLDRLKVCENSACHWVFHDTTRSRTRRWCASNCGSLIKVRRFRVQQKRVT